MSSSPSTAAAETLLSSDCTAHTLMRRRHRGCFYRHSLTHSIDLPRWLTDRDRPDGRTHGRTAAPSNAAAASGAPHNTFVSARPPPPPSAFFFHSRPPAGVLLPMPGTAREDGRGCCYRRRRHCTQAGRHMR